MSPRLALLRLSSLALVPVVCSMACAEPPPDVHEGTAEISHPTLRDLPAANRIDAYVRRDESSVERQTFEFVARLRDARQQRLGANAFRGWGRLRDAAAGNNGVIAVLDSELAVVRSVDRSGKNLGELLHDAGDALQLVDAVRISYTGEGDFVISERGGRITEVGSAGVKHTRLEGLGELEAACRIGERLFAKTPDPPNGDLIHYRDRDDHRSGSFGELPYSTEFDGVRWQLGRGLIACFEHADTLLIVFENLPLIQGYSAEGKLLWTSMLADAEMRRLVEVRRPNGRRATRWESDGQITIGLEAATQTIAVIQMINTESSPDQRRRVTGVDSYAVDVTTGHGMFIGSDLPGLLTFANEGRFYGVELVEGKEMLAAFTF